MLADYHIHTHFSSDSEAGCEEYIQLAISKGMKEICFTDHVDFDYPPENGKEMFRIDSKAYFDELLSLKDKYRNTIRVKVGIELGLNRDNDKLNNELLSACPFDFVIGSSHVVEGIDPYYPAYWEQFSVKDGITKYFEAILNNVTVYENYDVYGHLDYIRRYVPIKDYIFPYDEYSDIIDMILKNIIAKGHGIELNTRGLTQGFTTFVPTIRVVSRYRELGGEIITVGSDSHYLKSLGYGFRTAKDILTNTGFKYITTFDQRRPTFIPLNEV